MHRRQLTVLLRAGNLLQQATGLIVLNGHKKRPDIVIFLQQQRDTLPYAALIRSSIRAVPVQNRGTDMPSTQQVQRQQVQEWIHSIRFRPRLSRLGQMFCGWIFEKTCRWLTNESATPPPHQ